MIPLFVDCTGKRITIFGGGEVAARKAGHFANEADIVMISRTFTPACRELPVELKTMDTCKVTDAEIATIVASSFLVIGALSDKMENNRIGELCRKHGVLYNSADGEPGNVTIPAMTIGSHHTIAISTHGRSPAVSRFVRQEIEKRYPVLDEMVILQERLRKVLKNRSIPQTERRRILSDVLSDKMVWTLLKRSPECAWEDVSARYLS